MLQDLPDAAYWGLLIFLRVGTEQALLGDDDNDDTSRMCETTHQPTHYEVANYHYSLGR